MNDVFAGINIALCLFLLWQNWRARRLFERLSHVMLSTTKENAHELADRVVRAVFDPGPEWREK